ncbi:hypothetical protein F5880DRAFT_1503040 [Lentinula raphanica]|nr:hypothetical protein F5880DRAFT_1503040 [Lentinula raphanica]
MTRPAKVKLRAMFILGVVSSAVLAAPTSVGPSLSFEARSTEAQALQPPEEPSSGDGLHGGHHAYNAPDAPSAVERANVDVPLRAGVDHPKGDYLKRGLDNQNSEPFKGSDTYTIREAASALESDSVQMQKTRLNSVQESARDSVPDAVRHFSNIPNSVQKSGQYWAERAKSGS